MELKVRSHKGHIASPTSTAAHVAYLLILAGFVAFWVLAYHTAAKGFWVFAGIILGAVSLTLVRDAVTWGRAPPAAREAFRAEVERLRAARTQRYRS